jgi:hypothetical protein
MPASFSIKDNSAQIVRALEQLARQQVLVGIPQSNDIRPGDPLGNAAIGYINEYGSPINNIPPRAWLIPGIQQAHAQTTRYFEQAINHALQGNAGGSMRALHAAGQYTVNVVKVRIQSFIQPVLSPRTIQNRINRNPHRRQVAAATQPIATNFIPLIDTGEFINNIQYVVRVK